MFYCIFSVLTIYKALLWSPTVIALYRIRQNHIEHLCYIVLLFFYILVLLNSLARVSERRIQLNQAIKYKRVYVPTPSVISSLKQIETAILLLVNRCSLFAKDCWCMCAFFCSFLCFLFLFYLFVFFGGGGGW